MVESFLQAVTIKGRYKQTSIAVIGPQWKPLYKKSNLISLVILKCLPVASAVEGSTLLISNVAISLLLKLTATKSSVPELILMHYMGDLR